VAWPPYWPKCAIALVARVSPYSFIEVHVSAALFIAGGVGGILQSSPVIFPCILTSWHLRLECVCCIFLATFDMIEAGRASALEGPRITCRLFESLLVPVAC
jgi:hypothetical protein